MKSKVLIIILLAFIIGSCSKEKEVVNTVYIQTPATLIGSWNWISTSGGIAGIYTTPQSTGEIKRIEFDTNNNFKYYVNNKLISEHKFQVEKGTTITSQDSALIIKNILGFRQSITFITNDTLVLFDEYYDGYCYYFNRLSKK